ncbi:MAG: response regulator [Lachnospiraceae bacterium]|nr:response regulator [Lachnospiraceae bacterium]
MRFKVLVTGANKKLINDICKHLEADRDYITVRCPAIHSELFELTLSELPRVIIICLGNETLETINAYNVLKDSVKVGNCTVIVITNEDDKQFFMKYTRINKVLFLSRPVSLFALYEKLITIEEEMAQQRDQTLSQFEGFNLDDDGSNRRKHILVVDDDTEQLVMIKEQLSEFYDVTLVKSGDAALKFLTKKIPDLILLDFLMPDENGPQVLRRFRANEVYATIPVVFLTGMKEKKTVIHTLTELRPQGYIIKPAKKSELVAKIIDVLG